MQGFLTSLRNENERLSDNWLPERFHCTIQLIIPRYCTIYGAGYGLIQLHYDGIYVEDKLQPIGEPTLISI